MGAKVNWNGETREVGVSIWEQNEDQTFYDQISKEGYTQNSYATEEQFEAKLKNMVPGEKLVMTTRWKNLIDPARIGIVSHHFGFRYLKGNYREGSLIAAEEAGWTD